MRADLRGSALRWLGNHSLSLAAITWLLCACSEGRFLRHCADGEHVFLGLSYAAPSQMPLGSFLSFFSSFLLLTPLPLTPSFLLLHQSRNTCLRGSALDVAQLGPFLLESEAPTWFQLHWQCQIALMGSGLCAQWFPQNHSKVGVFIHVFQLKTNRQSSERKSGSPGSRDFAFKSSLLSIKTSGSSMNGGTERERERLSQKNNTG